MDESIVLVVHYPSNVNAGGLIKRSITVTKIVKLLEAVIGQHFKKRAGCWSREGGTVGQLRLIGSSFHAVNIQSTTIKYKGGKSLKVFPYYI